jgi:hypothetical protein
MAEPTIKNGEEHFFPIIYEGTGTGRRVGKFVPFTNNGTIANSVIFNDGDSPYLTRTQDSGTGDQKRKATFSWWFKRGSSFGTEMIHVAAAASSRLLVRFDTSNRLVFRLTNGTTEYQKVTNRTFEDTSKWYHCHWQIDASQSTATDRSKVWIDGNQITSWSSDSNPSQNTDVVGLSDGTTQRVSGTSHSTGQYFDGYLAEFNYCDGVITTVDNFGITDTSTGRWIPKTLSGITYGTNGFRLTFADSSALGDDLSGNTNDFTSSGLTSTDQTTDSPTQNFITFGNGERFFGTQQATEQGGLTIYAASGSGYPGVSAGKEIPQSGKWYWEVKLDAVGAAQGITNPTYGVIDRNIKEITGFSTSSQIDQQVGGMGGTFWSGFKFGGLLSTGTDFTIGSYVAADDDYVLFAFDMDNGKAWWGFNDSSAGSSVVWFANDGGTDGNPSTGANPTVTFTPSNHRFVPIQQFYAPGSGYSARYNFNFGSKAFAFTAPTGFNGLSQNNFPATDKGISGLSWIKDRDATRNHNLFDSSRGKQKELRSNSTDEEFTNADTLQKFLKGGFSIEDGTSVNTSGNSFVSWNWVANGGTTVTNETGAINSVVQANTTAGFSIVKYTGSGSSASIGHGLSAAPEVIWIKDRDNGSTNWRCWHTGFGNITTYQKLNSDDGYGSASMWGTPTASAIIVGGTGYEVNESGTDYVAYCWHGVDGFSKFGRFTGSNDTDGPFIYTGFKPAFVMIKGYTIGNNWIVWDNKRSTFNPCDNVLYPDLDQAETTSGNDLDFLSNGFKCRGSNSNYNGSYDYLYWAWAEHPFIGDGTSPVTAR